MSERKPFDLQLLAYMADLRDDLPSEVTVEPDYRAELAEFVARVRYLADDLRCDVALTNVGLNDWVADQLFELTGPWPHEVGGCPECRSADDSHALDCSRGKP